MKTRLRGRKSNYMGELPNRSDRVMVYVEGVSTIEEARAYVLGLAPELEPILFSVFDGYEIN